jgi:hypothetical protein
MFYAIKKMLLFAAMVHSLLVQASCKITVPYLQTGKVLTPLYLGKSVPIKNTENLKWNTKKIIP